MILDYANAKKGAIAPSRALLSDLHIILGSQIIMALITAPNNDAQV
jgi:hypothetical protein